MSLSMIMIIVLVLILLGALPTWPHSRSWGDGIFLYGIMYTIERVHSDLTSFVRDKQSIASCNTFTCVRVKFRRHALLN